MVKETELAGQALEKAIAGLHQPPQFPQPPTISSLKLTTADKFHLSAEFPLGRGEYYLPYKFPSTFSDAIMSSLQGIPANSVNFTSAPKRF